MLAPRPPAHPGTTGGPSNRSLRLTGPIGAVLGLPTGAAAALVAWALGGNVMIGLALAASAAALLAAVTTPLGALGAAAQCWACFDGFVIHNLGTLGMDSADLAAFGAIVGAAAVTHLVAVLVAVERWSTSSVLPGSVALGVALRVYLPGQ